MNEHQDWAGEQVRRRALANLRITKELGKFPTVSQSKFVNKPSTSLENEPKENMLTVFLGGMLTLTSIILVSICFITTLNAYDRVVNEANMAPGIIASDNDGGPLITRMQYPLNPRFNAYNAPRNHWRNFREERYRI
jgi:hypothetical protein